MVLRRQKGKEVLCEEEGPDGIYSEGVGELAMIELGRGFLRVQDARDRQGEAEVMRLSWKQLFGFLRCLGDCRFISRSVSSLTSMERGASVKGLPVTSTSRTVNRSLSTPSKPSSIDFLKPSAFFLAVATTGILVV